MLNLSGMMGLRLREGAMVEWMDMKMDGDICG